MYIFTFCDYLLAIDNKKKEQGIRISLYKCDFVMNYVGKTAIYRTVT